MKLDPETLKNLKLAFVMLRHVLGLTQDEIREAMTPPCQSRVSRSTVARLENTENLSQPNARYLVWVAHLTQSVLDEQYAADAATKRGVHAERASDPLLLWLAKTFLGQEDEDLKEQLGRQVKRIRARRHATGPEIFAPAELHAIGRTLPEAYYRLEGHRDNHSWELVVETAPIVYEFLAHEKFPPEVLARILNWWGLALVCQGVYADAAKILDRAWRNFGVKIAGTDKIALGILSNLFASHLGLGFKDDSARVVALARNHYPGHPTPRQNELCYVTKFEPERMHAVAQEYVQSHPSVANPESKLGKDLLADQDLEGFRKSEVFGLILPSLAEHLATQRAPEAPEPKPAVPGGDFVISVTH